MTYWKDARKEDSKDTVNCIKEKEVKKGIRGMPRLSEATMDVVRCEKLRGGANGRRYADVRMGEPVRLKT